MTVTTTISTEQPDATMEATQLQVSLENNRLV